MCINQYFHCVSCSCDLVCCVTASVLREGPAELRIAFGRDFVRSWTLCTDNYGRQMKRGLMALADSPTVSVYACTLYHVQLFRTMDSLRRRSLHNVNCMHILPVLIWYGPSETGKALCFKLPSPMFFWGCAIFLFLKMNMRFIVIINATLV